MLLLLVYAAVIATLNMLRNPYGHVLQLLKSILLCAVCLAASRDPKVCMRIQRIVKFIGCCGLYLYEHIVIAVLLVML
jgi:hypothetical protein